MRSTARSKIAQHGLMQAATIAEAQADRCRLPPDIPAQGPGAGDGRGLWTAGQLADVVTSDSSGGHVGAAVLPG